MSSLGDIWLGNRMPTGAAGLRRRFGVCMERVAVAREIGWPALEASWQADLDRVAAAMRQAGIAIPLPRRFEELRASAGTEILPMQPRIAVRTSTPRVLKVLKAVRKPLTCREIAARSATELRTTREILNRLIFEGAAKKAGLRPVVYMASKESAQEPA